MILLRFSRLRPQAFFVLVCMTSTFTHADDNPLGRTTTGEVGDALEFAVPAVVLSSSLIKKDWQGARQMGLGLAATIASTHVLKSVVHKQRPDGRDNDSFPSSHTAVTMHAASFVHERYGWRWAAPVYATAAYVGYSRVYDDRHDEQDVLAGAVIGVVLARLFTTQFESERLAGLRVTPAVAPEFVGVSISYTH